MNNDKTLLRKILASAIAASLIAAPVTSGPVQAESLPGWAAELAPSPRLGQIVASAGDASQPLVVLIQDLHFNRSVQNNVVDLLSFYEKKLGRTAIGVEGATGALDYSELVNYSHPEWKKDLVHFLLKHGELTGPEAYTTLAGEPRLLYGIEDAKYYAYHLELFRRSYELRSGLQRSVSTLATELAALENRVGHSSKNAALVRNLQAASEDVRLLEQLLAQRLTLDEARQVNARLPQTLALIQALQPVLTRKVVLHPADIQEAVNSGLDFYAAALMRDNPMGSNTVGLLNGKKAVIQVAGGFHTAGVTRLLKQQGIRYIVIAPEINENTVEDEQVYVDRLLDRHTSLAVAQQSAIYPSALGRIMLWASPAGRAVRNRWTAARVNAPALARRAFQGTWIERFALRGMRGFMPLDNPGGPAGGRPAWHSGVLASAKALYDYTQMSIQYDVDFHSQRVGKRFSSIADLVDPSVTVRNLKGEDVPLDHTTSMSSFALRNGLDPKTDLGLKPADLTFEAKDIPKEKVESLIYMLLQGGLLHQMMYAGEQSRLKKSILDQGIQVTDEELAAMYFTDIGFLAGQARSMPFGPRQLLQLRLEIERLARANPQLGISPEQAIANQKILFQFNEKTHDRITQDLVSHNFYGFNPANIVVIPQHVDRPFTLVDGKVVPAKVDEPVALGHGWLTLETAMKGVGYQVDALGHKTPLKNDALAFFLDKGATVAHQYRINDMYMVTPDVVEPEYLAMEYDQIRSGQSFYIARMYLNDTPQKTGIPLVTKKPTLTGATQAMADQVSSSDPGTVEFLLGESGGEPLAHKFTNTWAIQPVRQALQDTGFMPDFELKKFIQDGKPTTLINTQYVTGALVSNPTLKAKYAYRKGQRIADFKELNVITRAAALWNAQSENPEFASLARQYSQTSSAQAASVVRRLAEPAIVAVRRVINAVRTRLTRATTPVEATPLARAVAAPHVSEILAAPAADAPAPVAPPQPSHLAATLQSFFHFNKADEQNDVQARGVLQMAASA
jgi:hypothetical protein